MNSLGFDSASFLRFALAPLPVPDFRHILAVLVDVVLMLNELVAHLLLQVGAFGTHARQAIHHILHQMKAVQIVLHSHVKGSRDGALFFVASNVQVVVGPAVGEPVDQRRVSMETKYDVFVFREQRVVILLA